MLRTFGVLCVCLSALSAYSQSPTSKYQVATIMAVKPHKAAAATDDSATSYDVSVRVADVVYVVLYIPPPGVRTVQYAAGREVLVLVGNKKITYNDILGNSIDVPILSRNTISKQSGR